MVPYTSEDPLLASLESDVKLIVILTWSVQESNFLGFVQGGECNKAPIGQELEMYNGFSMAMFMNLVIFDSRLDLCHGFM